MDFMLGGIISFGGNFAPVNWAYCYGQEIAINTNQALYSLLGTTWGGNGRATFGLPDLRSRVPIGVGTGPGLTSVVRGQRAGWEYQRLTTNQMPAHTHLAEFHPIPSAQPGGELSATASFKVSSDDATSATPVAGGYFAKSTAPNRGPDKDEYIYASTATNSTILASDVVSVTVSGESGGISGGTITVGQTGGNQVVPIMQPTLGMDFIIATDGTYPSRS